MVILDCVIVVIIALVVIVLGLVIGAVLGRIPVDGMDEPTATTPTDHLPAGDLTPDDLATVRIDQSFRGYRMDQVDHLLDRLHDQLQAQQAELDELRGRARH